MFIQRNADSMNRRRYGNCESWAPIPNGQEAHDVEFDSSAAGEIRLIYPDGILREADST
jgi:hypothetical protein